MFSLEEGQEDIGRETSFDALLPEVPADKWTQWHHAFDAFDINGDGAVQFPELLRSGCISAEVGKYVLSYVDPDKDNQFTRDGFLRAMLKAHGYRAPHNCTDYS